jgi:hypothetical protein
MPVISLDDVLLDTSGMGLGSEEGHMLRALSVWKVVPRPRHPDCMLFSDVNCVVVSRCRDQWACDEGRDPSVRASSEAVEVMDNVSALCMQEQSARTRPVRSTARDRIDT